MKKIFIFWMLLICLGLLAGCMGKANQQATKTLAATQTPTLTPSFTPSLTPTITATPAALPQPLGMGESVALDLAAYKRQGMLFSENTCLNETGQLMLGAAENCQAASSAASLRFDIPLELALENALAVISIACNQPPCMENHQAVSAGEKPFRLLLNDTLLWAADVSEENASYFTQQDSAIEVTYRTHDLPALSLALETDPGALWQVGEVQVKLIPLPLERVMGYAYSPYRACQTPKWGSQPELAGINEDLERLQHSSNAIRTYSATGANQEIVLAAKSLGLQVGMGIWLNNNRGMNEAELQAAQEFLAQNAQAADFVIVGNEALLRQDLSAQELAGYIRQMDARTDAPLAYAEVFSLLLEEQNRPVVDAVDYLLVHIYPYWNGVSIDQATDYVVAAYRQVQEAFPEKRVIIGETGWPSHGETRGQAVASLENQHRFFIEFTAAAEKYGMEYFYFSLFDEPWKTDEGIVGAHWGVSSTYRTNKFESESLFAPRPPALLADVNPGDFGVQITAVASVMPSVVAEAASTPEPQALAPLLLYDEFPPGEWFSASWWMGDFQDIGSNLCDASQPYQGNHALQLHYLPGTELEQPLGWGGMLWEYPENNRGEMPQGRDLTGYQSIRFFARGEEGGEQVAFMLGGTQTGQYPSSIQRPLLMEVSLTQEWQEYSFDLRGQDLSHVIDAFGWSASSCKNPQGAVFYLDAIEWRSSPPPPTRLTPLALVNNGCLYAALDLGVDTSGRKRDWATISGGSIRLEYPPGQQWGAAFIYPSQQMPPGRKAGRDLSGYTSLEVTLRGANGGERVEVGIKDWNDPDNGTEKKMPLSLTSQWETHTFKISDFRKGNYADPENLNVLVEFVFSGSLSQSIYVRSVVYRP